MTETRSGQTVTTEPDHLRYDVVVVGAGAVGENVAGRVAAGGLRCLLVERELVGGECSYWACMPSKALLRPTQAIAEARRVPGAAAAVTGSVDVEAVLARRDGVASDWDDQGQVAWVLSAGIDLLRGQARVAAEREVVVTSADGGSVTVHADVAVVVCTGSEPVTPPVPGLDEVEFWTSRDATSTHAVPESLVVLGGGVVGVELAQAFSRLGSTVTLVSRGRLLARAEPRAAELITEALREDGIEVRDEAEVARVAAADGGGVVVELDDGSTVTGERLLVATGRRPATGGIGLEEWGIEPGKPVTVDDTGMVEGLTWLYAAGDVTGRAPLTHQGKYAARAVGAALLARHEGTLGPSDLPAPWSAEVATADHDAIPQVVFTDPQVAWVGPTAEEARERFPHLRSVEYDIANVAGASVHDDAYRGWAQMLVDEDRGVLVGVTFVGPDVAELLHSATVAVVGEVPLTRLWHAVPSYPTTSEVWLRLLETYGL